MLRWTQRVGKVHGKDQAFRILSIARVAFIFSGRTDKTRTVHGEEVAMKGQLSDDEFKVLLPGTTTASENESLHFFNRALL